MMQVIEERRRVIYSVKKKRITSSASAEAKKKQLSPRGGQPPDPAAGAWPLPAQRAEFSQLPPVGPVPLSVAQPLSPAAPSREVVSPPSTWHGWDVSVREVGYRVRYCSRLQPEYV